MLDISIMIFKKINYVLVHYYINMWQYHKEESSFIEFKKIYIVLLIFNNGLTIMYCKKDTIVKYLILYNFFL